MFLSCFITRFRFSFAWVSSFFKIFVSSYNLTFFDILLINLKRALLNRVWFFWINLIALRIFFFKNCQWFKQLITVSRFVQSLFNTTRNFSNLFITQWVNCFLFLIFYKISAFNFSIATSFDNKMLRWFVLSKSIIILKNSFFFSSCLFLIIML